MGLELVGFAAKGDEANERVVFRATADGNLAGYVVADRTLKDGKTSNKFRHTFWFPDRKVKKGDLVYLRTGSGDDGKGTTKDGTPVHRFFWDVGVGVWNDTGDTVYLLKVEAKKAAATWAP